LHNYEPFNTTSVRSIFNYTETHKQEIHDQLWGRGLLHSGFSWGYLRIRNHFEETGVDGRISFMDFQAVKLQRCGLD
jgi:hypothetical protein